MFPSATRALLRRPHAARMAFRNASTTSEATNAASSPARDVANKAQSKASSQASSGLSRVNSSAEAATSKVSSAVSSTASQASGRTGQMMNFVQSLVPPTLYYSRVALELGKLIAQGRKMSPPDVATFQSYYQTAMKHMQNPSSLFQQASSSASSTANSMASSMSSMNPGQMVNNIRNMDSQQMVSAGIVVLEVLGFFTVGEMIGRFKIIGYRGGHAHDEHH